MLEELMYGYTGWYASMLILVPAIILTFYAQLKVKSSYREYSSVPTRNHITGAQAARKMLDANGLGHVQINMISGELTDHYNPTNQTVNLSQGVCNATSIAAIGVACHECGHAIQHAMGYGPLKLRNFIIPATRFGSGLAIPLFVAGLILSIPGLELLGILFFSFSVVFQVVTLPVEFNASRRALAQIVDLGIVEPEEKKGAKKVLSAAAMTYVAAMLMALLQLLRLIIIARGRR